MINPKERAVYRLLAICFVSLFVAVASAEQPSNDLKALQGSWMLISSWDNGDQVPAELSQGIAVEIKGDKYVENVNGRSSVASLKIDPSKKPKWFDWTWTSGPLKGISFIGVYELQGDTLK